MAAQDDKISDNRRRLFKALSAAPVVMTLRPGTAAASSAYQCVQNTRAENYDPFSGALGPFPGNSDPINNFVIENVPRLYWDAENGASVEDSFGNPVSCDQVIPTDAYIVEYTIGGVKRYFAQGSNGVGGNQNEILNAAVVDDDLQIKNSSEVFCYVIRGPSSTGYWPVVVYSNDDDTDVSIRTLSYPRRFLRADGNRPAGANQLINGTCLCSVMPGVQQCVSSG